MEHVRTGLEIAGMICVSAGAFLVGTALGLVVTGAGLLGLSWTLGKGSR